VQRPDRPIEARAFPAAAFCQWLKSEHAVRDLVFGTMAGRLLDVMTMVEEVSFG